MLDRDTKTRLHLRIDPINIIFRAWITAPCMPIHSLPARGIHCVLPCLRMGLCGHHQGQYRQKAFDHEVSLSMRVR